MVEQTAESEKESIGQAQFQFAIRGPTRVKVFKAIVRGLDKLLSDVNIEIGPEGFKIFQYDPSRAALVRIHLTQDFFNAFDCAKESVICVGTDDLLNAVSSAQRSLRLFIEGDTLVVSRDGSIFHVPLLELVASSCKSAKTFDATTFHLTGRNFRNAVKQATSVERYAIILTVKDSKLLLTSGGSSGLHLSVKEAYRVKGKARVRLSAHFLDFFSRFFISEAGQMIVNFMIERVNT